ncbi:hypothetical protein [Lactobacillus gasseri]|uniref:Uncharacterized protein n=1 Tax=Lactobacillus gasseri TaxID=1596 RepID=A0AB33ZTX6_LACGS|nr:hypothetical protein [Lactobacillus gasseri]GBA95519.1 hypothetical protein LJCM1025_05270 [Lactobacillus gasseri]
MVQFSAREKGFHNEIEAVIDVDKDNEKLKKYGQKILLKILLEQLELKNGLEKQTRRVQ